MFDITDGQTIKDLANFFVQNGSELFCPGPYPGTIMTVPCYGDQGSVILTFDEWLNQIGVEEQTEGHGVEIDENGDPILEFNGFELQWRDEYDFLFWTVSIDGEAQNNIAEFFRVWGQGVGGAVNFWSGGGNNPNIPVPGENGALVRIPLPDATSGPYPE